MKKTIWDGVDIIGLQNYDFDDGSCNYVNKTIMSQGCGCCLCSPDTSASGAGNFTATASGKG
jgi:hypothetical protein